MRVAFTLIGGAGWTGGINYLENLLSAVHDYPECNVQPVLFAGEDVDSEVIARLAPYLVEPPVLSPAWNDSRRVRMTRLLAGFGLQSDFLVEREFKKASIDVVFQHAAWYGCRFGIPTLAWIADFQHKRLPKMFSKMNYYWRDVGYWALSHCATRLMVSSQDAKSDCEKFYPKSIDRVDAVPFAVKMGNSVSNDELLAIRDLYQLPEKFYFLPNQFWRHKNHLNVVEALKILKESGSNVILVSSGNPRDSRNPTHPKKVFDLVKEYGLEGSIIFLGMIPFQHILPLMRLSAAVVNPSFFEGWSTTVEEAKSVGAPLLLSDLPIHREQAKEECDYFDAYDPDSISDTLNQAWNKLQPGPRLDAEKYAVVENKDQRKQFAKAFGNLVKYTLEVNNA